MTTTLNVRPNGQVELPEDFRKRQKIKTGTVLRVTEIGGGLFVTPHAEPTESEFREILEAAGSLPRMQTPEDEKDVQELITNYRREKRSKRG